MFPVDVQVQTRVKEGFFRLCELPQVMGAVDETLIPIIAPKEHNEAFVRKKGFHALNIQGIVDSELR
ncbi:hypothetical protein DPMN_143632 [Dreissena polymorpha]|uniref:Uncharacterized protein n=1 Tax=Dreissena polymorpha TaxID=45954 RepID=A0A9D4GGK3_DREPO|nr:hypothetical protein DPMN_143632 [Dreissena polymorpha]